MTLDFAAFFSHSFLTFSGGTRMFRKAPWVLALLGSSVWLLAVSAGAQPIGGIDTPGDNSTVTGIVRVSGFVLDFAAVDRVDVLVDGVVVNHADTGLPRPD